MYNSHHSTAFQFFITHVFHFYFYCEKLHNCKNGNGCYFISISHGAYGDKNCIYSKTSNCLSYKYFKNYLYITWKNFSIFFIVHHFSFIFISFKIAYFILPLFYEELVWKVLPPSAIGKKKFSIFWSIWIYFHAT